jgi:hypothetical protein
VDVIVARFRGGPCDGYELAMMGGLPSYVPGAIYAHAEDGRPDG